MRNYSSNEELVVEFVNGYVMPTHRNRNLWFSENRLYHFDTIIALRGVGKEIVLNKEKYSRSTSTLQTLIRKNARAIREVTEEEINDLADMTIAEDETEDAELFRRQRIFQEAWDNMPEEDRQDIMNILNGWL